MHIQHGFIAGFDRTGDYHSKLDLQTERRPKCSDQVRVNIEVTTLQTLLLAGGLYHLTRALGGNKYWIPGLIFYICCIPEQECVIIHR